MLICGRPLIRFFFINRLASSEMTVIRESCLWYCHSTTHFSGFPEQWLFFFFLIFPTDSYSEVGFARSVIAALDAVMTLATAALFGKACLSLQMYAELRDASRKIVSLEALMTGST